MIKERIGSLLMSRIPNFHILFWYGNFVERYSFHRVSGGKGKISDFSTVKCVNIDTASLS